MKNLKFLNKKEIKEFINKLNKYFDCNLDLDYEFLLNKDRIFIVSRGIRNIDLNNFNINSIGLYFGKIGPLRLTIEGSQLIGNKARKNIIELDDRQIEDWIRGMNIEVDSDSNEFVVVKYKNDYYGSGKVKNKMLLNYVPKDRRIK